MSRCRSRAPLFAVSFSVCLLTLALGGCASRDTIEPPAYEDDFGESYEPDPITEQSVAEETMLHQHAQFDLTVGAVVPIDSNVSTTVGIGGKFNYEIFKRLYAGLFFGYSNLDVKEGADSLQTSNPSKLYDSMNRYSILLVSDYDIPLTRPSSDFGAFTLRFGLGLGMLIVDGREDKSLSGQGGGGYEIETFYGFLMWPEVEIRWRVWEHGHLFAGVSYDWTPQSRIEVKDASGDRFEVSSDIQFDVANAVVGFSFEW